MPIFFDPDSKKITLKTKNTAYVMQILYDRFPVHLFYGKAGNEANAEYVYRCPAFSPYFEDPGTAYVPDACLAEYSYFGSGDYRETALRIKNRHGNSVTLFDYVSHRIFDGRIELDSLPYSTADDTTQTLELKLTDKVTGCDLYLYYTVFFDCDVISRYAIVENHGDAPVDVEKIMSLSLDLASSDYDMISLWGQHCGERVLQRSPLFHGHQSIGSRRGASSHQFNPFMALCSKDANENTGEVYGFNFVYSGNFLDEVEVDQNGFTRVQIGIGSENFTWHLEPGESFTAPEAIMTYSHSGIGKMSRNFHSFVREHIIPSEPFEKRPVVLNTWEACYFDINEAEMLRFADAAAEAGCDMLVMDDGWFSTRKSDNAGLGDWWPDMSKFPDGLGKFVDRIKSRGVKFGIWVEPEMVNPDSELYRNHPEWCLSCPGRESTLSRNQLVLDMSDPNVVEYLKESFFKTFEDFSPDYFKWDMNRHLSEVASNALPPERQGETSHRYMMGVYSLIKAFRERFPNAMIETCSGGGGRYDLGMMKYSTQIWTSDNTWPQRRIKIQHASTIAYPTCMMSCHVANHPALATEPDRLTYRWHTALNGPLGYEFHLPNAEDSVKAAVKAQTEAYRKYEDLILRGDLYRLLSPFEGNYYSYYFTDGKDFLLIFEQLEPEEPTALTLKISQADPSASYYETSGKRIYSGKELSEGICFDTENKEVASRLWHFVKQ